MYATVSGDYGNLAHNLGSNGLTHRSFQATRSTLRCKWRRFWSGVFSRVVEQIDNVRARARGKATARADRSTSCSTYVCEFHMSASV